MFSLTASRLVIESLKPLDLGRLITSDVPAFLMKRETTAGVTASDWVGDGSNSSPTGYIPNMFPVRTASNGMHTQCRGEDGMS